MHALGVSILTFGMLVSIGRVDGIVFEEIFVCVLIGGVSRYKKEEEESWKEYTLHRSRSPHYYLQIMLP